MRTIFLFLFFTTITRPQAKLIANNIPKLEINDTTFVNLQAIDTTFVLDMKYATTDNFLKIKVYDCQACYLRYKTVKSLCLANKAFLKKGFRIKIWDCYRPIAVQKKMWDIMPNPDYVANPSRGSMHNRGNAVDITLVNNKGEELEMGTGFDFFGPQASHSYNDLSEQVMDNRKIIKKIMRKNNFEALNSEWWHYNLKDAKKDGISNFIWPCKN